MAHIRQDENDQWYLADDWHIEDVLNVRPDLNEDQCIHVLEAMADWFDANDGINWIVITMTAEQLYPQDEENEENEENEE